MTNLPKEYDFFGSIEPQKESAKKFMNIVHHDLQSLGSGMVFRCIINKETNEITQLSSNNLDAIIDTQKLSTDKCSIYCSLNRFRGKKRDNNNLYAITGIVIDLDDHEHTGSYLEQAKSRTKCVLNDAYASGSLLLPTMAVDTGRGLHIYYILEHSIACIASTVSYRRYYDMIYDLTIGAYQDVLASEGLLTVDTKATLKTQLIRIPGFINPSSKTTAVLYENEVKYYSLDEIRKGCKLDERYDLLPSAEYHALKKNTKKSPSGNNNKNNLETVKIDNISSSSIINLNLERLAIFEKMQSMFNDRGQLIGVRDFLCFFYYNAATRVNHGSAFRMLKIFNSKFKIPLENAKLTEIAKTIDNVTNRHGEKGWYPISNAYIIDKLGLSDEDCQLVGLNRVTQDVERAASKAQTAAKRLRREQIISEVRQSNPNLDREKTLSIINENLTSEDIRPISASTMSRICKKLKLPFYANVLAYTDTQEYKREQERKKLCAEKKAQNNKQKTQITKNCLCGILSIVKKKIEVSDLDLDKVLNALAEYGKNLNDTEEKMILFFINYVKGLTLSTSQKKHLTAALLFILAEYQAHYWPESILFDLDNIYKKLQKNKPLRNIVVFGVSVSPTVYLKGAEWANRPSYNIEMLKPVIHKKTKKIDKYKDIEYNHIVREYNSLLTFEDWCRNNGFTPLYNMFYDEDPALLLKLKNCNRRKIRKIFTSWSGRLLSDPSAEIINEMIIAEFHTTRDSLKIQAPIRSEKQIAAAKVYASNKALWNWIFTQKKTLEETQTADLYQKINRFCKDNPDATVYIAGKSYEANYVKKKILYPTTIDNLKYISKMKPSCEEDLLKKLVDIKISTS